MFANTLQLLDTSLDDMKSPSKNQFVKYLRAALQVSRSFDLDRRNTSDSDINEIARLVMQFKGILGYETSVWHLRLQNILAN